MANVENQVELLTAVVVDLVETKREHAALFADIRADLASLRAGMGAIEGSLDGFDARFDRSDRRMQAIEGRMGGFDARFDRSDRAMEAIETRLGMVADEVRIHTGQLERLTHHIIRDDTRPKTA